MSSHPTRTTERRRLIWVMITQPGVICGACGQPIDPDTSADVFAEQPALVHHDGGCPPRRTRFRVIDGGGERGEQLTLPLLHSVPETEREPRR